MMNDMYVTSLQERQLLACGPLMEVEPLIPMSIVYEEEPLEKTRLYGPFSLEVILWMNKLGPVLVKMGWDSDGKEYIEY